MSSVEQFHLVPVKQQFTVGKKKVKKLQLCPHQTFTNNAALPKQLAAKWCSAGKLTERKDWKVKVHLRLPQTIHKTNSENRCQYITAEKLFSLQRWILLIINS